MAASSSECNASAAPVPTAPCPASARAILSAILHRCPPDELAALLAGSAAAHSSAAFKTGRLEAETDPVKSDARARQLAFGLSSIGYERYRLTVPRAARRPRDPATPEPRLAHAKRSWDAAVRQWRRQLHEWDLDRGVGEGGVTSNTAISRGGGNNGDISGGVLTPTAGDKRSRPASSSTVNLAGAADAVVTVSSAPAGGLAHIGDGGDAGSSAPLATRADGRAVALDVRPCSFDFLAWVYADAQPGRLGTMNIFEQRHAPFVVTTATSSADDGDLGLASSSAGDDSDGDAAANEEEGGARLSSTSASAATTYWVEWLERRREGLFGGGDLTWADFEGDDEDDDSSNGSEDAPVPQYVAGAVSGPEAYYFNAPASSMLMGTARGSDSNNGAAASSATSVSAQCPQQPSSAYSGSFQRAPHLDYSQRPTQQSPFLQPPPSQRANSSQAPRNSSPPPPQQLPHAATHALRQAASALTYASYAGVRPPDRWEALHASAPKRSRVREEWGRHFSALVEGGEQQAEISRGLTQPGGEGSGGGGGRAIHGVPLAQLRSRSAAAAAEFALRKPVDSRGAVETRALAVS